MNNFDKNIKNKLNIIYAILLLVEIIFSSNISLVASQPFFDYEKENENIKTENNAIKQYNSELEKDKLYFKKKECQFFKKYPALNKILLEIALGVTLFSLLVAKFKFNFFGNYKKSFIAMFGAIFIIEFFLITIFSHDNNYIIKKRNAIIKKYNVKINNLEIKGKCSSETDQLKVLFIYLNLFSYIKKDIPQIYKEFLEEIEKNFNEQYN